MWKIRKNNRQIAFNAERVLRAAQAPLDTVFAYFQTTPLGLTNEKVESGSRSMEKGSPSHPPISRRPGGEHFFRGETLRNDKLRLVGLWRTNPTLSDRQPICHEDGEQAKREKPQTIRFQRDKEPRSLTGIGSLRRGYLRAVMWKQPCLRSCFT